MGAAGSRRPDPYFSDDCLSAGCRADHLDEHQWRLLECGHELEPQFRPGNIGQRIHHQQRNLHRKDGCQPNHIQPDAGRNEWPPNPHEYQPDPHGKSAQRGEFQWNPGAEWRQFGWSGHPRNRRSIAVEWRQQRRWIRPFDPDQRGGEYLFYHRPGRRFHESRDSKLAGGKREYQHQRLRRKRWHLESPGRDFRHPVQSGVGEFLLSRHVSQCGPAPQTDGRRCHVVRRVFRQFRHGRSPIWHHLLCFGEQSRRHLPGGYQRGHRIRWRRFYIVQPSQFSGPGYRAIDRRQSDPEPIYRNFDFGWHRADRPEYGRPPPAPSTSTEAILGPALRSRFGPMGY